MRIAIRLLVLVAIPFVALGSLVSVTNAPPIPDPFLMDHDWGALYWLWAGGVYFVGALTFVVLIRALVGMWARPDLSLRPSPGTVALLALGALLAAVPNGIDAGVQFLTLH